MKDFLIFAIICSLGVPTILGRPNSKEDTDAEWEQPWRECARELNIDEKIFEDNGGRSLEKNMCIQACVSRKSAIEDLIGTNNKETNYNVFSKIIEEVYKAGFESTEFTREDVIDKVENCYAAERTECEFVKCLDPLHLEIGDVLNYMDKHNLESTVFNFDKFYQ